jgi:GTP-binding protein
MKIYSAEIIKSCVKPADFPATALPEIAFLGRSNVGKSSLLNRLVNRKKLARTSSTPGKTRLIHFFRIAIGKDRELTFVDLPGYGWAKVSRKERASWGNMVETYLEEREVLRLAVLLQDLRRDFSEDESLLLEWLAERNIPSLVVLTKIDKLKPMRRKARLRALQKQIGDSASRVLATSSEVGIGMDELWKTILAAAD